MSIPNLPPPVLTAKNDVEMDIDGLQNSAPLSRESTIDSVADGANWSEVGVGAGPSQVRAK